MRQSLYKLHENLKSEIKGFRTANPSALEIPQYIVNNLKYELFDWQAEALEHFLYYLKNCEKEPKENFCPTHLLFNMATGSGKTLIMAACILYLYQQGYHHFIFTVSYNNIVNKTQNNFIYSNHPKYLFKTPIVIDGKQVNIKEVNNFSNYPEGIEIKFTTIHLLHNEIHTERENVNTLTDLSAKRIVILADEAHNLNAQTKIKTQQTTFLKETKEDLEQELTARASDKNLERQGWEHTLVDLIFLKNNLEKFNDNFLLEFTATVPSESAVAEKYSDKLIYKFDLKDFLKKGYTKEIILISSSFQKKERVLLGLVFNWYRHRIALKYKIANFKPVILFRSKDIESSYHDYDEFVDLIQNLKTSDFEFLKNIKDQIQQSKNPAFFEMAQTKAEQVIQYIFKSDHMQNLIFFLKNNFKENNLIITNSKTNKTKTEITDNDQEALLNSLEDPSNHIRGIFTVKRLTEGWDVLNLFDIVRLFESRDTGRDEKTGVTKHGKSTIEEKQLIGRGVRYYPFKYKDLESRKRKFDNDLNHELRILEEFCFHSIGSRYISELKDALVKEGYIDDKKIRKRFELKPEFQAKLLKQETKLAYNEKIENCNYKTDILKEIKGENYSITRYLEKIGLTIDRLSGDNANDFEREEFVSQEGVKNLNCCLKDYLQTDKHIFLKAINQLAQDSNSLYVFANLKQKLNIQSVDDLLSEKFFGDFKIYIKRCPKGKQFKDLEASIKLKIALDILQTLAQAVANAYSPHKGSEFKLGDFLDERFRGFVKEKLIEENTLKSNKYDWYVLDSFAGNALEAQFIEFIKDKMPALKNKYDDVFLIRNEEVYKIYDFKKGRGFQPDFLLFLSKENEKCCYQIFIEPKGSQFKDGSGGFEGSKEGWKQIFLAEIKDKYKDKGIFDQIENIEYRVIGLPFYNDSQVNKFESEFNKELL